MTSKEKKEILSRLLDSGENNPFSSLKKLCHSDCGWFEKEVGAFIRKSTQKTPENLSLEELRAVLVNYLQDELLKTKDQWGQSKGFSN